MGVEKMTISELDFALSLTTWVSPPCWRARRKMILFANHNNHCHFLNAHACVTKEQSFKCPTVCVRLRVRFTGSDGPSGFGFELTFRLKREAGETAPPTWPAELMQGLARYVFQSGKIQFQDCRCWQWSILRVNATVNLCEVMKV